MVKTNKIKEVINMAAKEKIEKDSAIEAVKEAEKKVADIKAEKAAKKAKKHEERLNKHPKLGKAINWVDDNKIPVGVGVLIGGPLGVAAVLGYQKIKQNKADEAIANEENSDEVEETPFEV